jgi:CRISPR/Cas system-associated exonuclease Cas4 (RecB family)
MSNDLLASFIDLDEAPAITVLDRSTLERYATCPAQAKFIETGRVMDRSAAAESGNAVHEALSAGVRAYVASRASLNPQELRAEVENAVLSARPDIQPDAVRGLRASLWAWAKWLHGLHPENILRFDGGEGVRSGQLAIDIPGVVRVTSELDFLHSGPSPKLLHEVDWKSGWKSWTVNSIRDSFQFQLHALLVLENYPDVDGLSVTVWDTRRNRRSWPVEFTRADLPAIRARVMSAAGEWWRAQHEEPPTWPTVDKCSKCPAAMLCPASGESSTVEETVDALAPLEAKVKLMRSFLSVKVGMRGEDIVTEAGNCFGFGKPKRAGRKVAELYQIEAPETEGNDDAPGE